MHRRPALLEQPRLSKMCWTHLWRSFVDGGLGEAVVASCQFGSPHRKEFRLLCHILDHQKIETRCPGGHDHVRIEGRFTKPSATYVDGLALHLAKAFRASLERLARLDDEPVSGFESLVTNDTLLTAPWRTSRAWTWRSKSHINVLEATTAVSLIKELAVTSPDSRQVILSDSKVAIGCLAKGRSPSFLLQRQCKMSGALQAVVYVSFSYAPTRLNVADDPGLLDFGSLWIFPLSITCLGIQSKSFTLHLFLGPMLVGCALHSSLSVFTLLLPPSSELVPVPHGPAFLLPSQLGFSTC